jgi:hypothetical protein
VALAVKPAEPRVVFGFLAELDQRYCFDEHLLGAAAARKKKSR